MQCSDCFINSPMNNTVDVVPSPLVSSCATAVLAIIMAVGFWICCQNKIKISPTKSPRSKHHWASKIQYHFLQQRVPILSKLDIPSSTNKPDKREIKYETMKRSKQKRRQKMGKRLHLDGSLGAEVGLEHILEAFGGVDVHVQRR